MMDDWPGILPHHKFVPLYTQATEKPKEVGASGCCLNGTFTLLLAPELLQL